MLPIVISRKDAKAAGIAHFFTAIPCKHGHVEMWQVRPADRGGRCLGCLRKSVARHKAESPAHIDRRARWAAKILERERRKALGKEERLGMVALERARLAKANRQRIRTARIRDAEGYHTVTDIEALRMKQANLCANPYCAVDITASFQVDHTIPIARNGSNWPANLQLLCQPCNTSKGALDNDFWLAKQSRIRGFEPVEPLDFVQGEVFQEEAAHDLAPDDLLIHQGKAAINPGVKGLLAPGRPPCWQKVLQQHAADWVVRPLMVLGLG